MEQSKKKIAVFTATRAEYGLLYWLMKDLQDSVDFELQLIVSGTHLSKGHGYTVDQIIADGFHIDAKVDLGLSEEDSRLNVAHAMSKATNGMAEALDELKPDMLFLLGDRYELLGAASAALVMGVPIFHLHGGEVTEGAYDDSIRHAVTKMADWHGVANKEYRDRVIQMGENESSVFEVGAMALDNIKRLNLLSKSDLESQLDFSFGEKTILLTFHPVTNAENPIEGFAELLAVLEEQKDISIVFTHPNADHGREKIVELIDRFVENNPSRAMVKDSLGQMNFLSALQYVDAVVGNSSSGIIEAPLMNVPTVNIGDRQKGRVQSGLIINAENQVDSIKLSLKKVFLKNDLKPKDLVSEVKLPSYNLIKILTNIFKC